MTIATALDKLNDKLAGSDQPASQTIEGMILRIIDNIDNGGGGGGFTLMPWTFDNGNIVLGATAQELLDGMIEGNLYGVYIDELVHEDGGWLMPAGVQVIYSCSILDDNTDGEADGYYFNTYSLGFYAESLSSYPYYSVDN